MYGKVLQYANCREMSVDWDSEFDNLEAEEGDPMLTVSPISIPAETSTPSVESTCLVQSQSGIKLFTCEQFVTHMNVVVLSGYIHRRGRTSFISSGVIST